MSALANNYNRKKIAFSKGKGSFLYSTNGSKYLDFVQGIAVNSLGHAHPKLVAALNKQSKKVWHVSNAFQIPEGEKLAKKLTQHTFADYVLFQNSGAEATEAAIKVARRYFYSIGQPKKNRIICIKDSFHGRTLATIFASGSKKMTEGFYPKVPGFDHFKFGDHTKLKKLITKKTAAIMVETVMGEGGIKVIPDWDVSAGRKLNWQVDSKSEGISSVLPSMTTDIELRREQMHIVIDTKFNSILTKGWYRENSLRSGYIYQMYTYLRSQENSDKPYSLNSIGILLHPCIEQPLNEHVTIQGHQIRFVTIDLAQPAINIKEGLLNIIEDV